MSTDGIASRKQLTIPFLLSAIAAALMVVAALPGVVVGSLYRDTRAIVATDRGSDLFTLIVAVPVLAISIFYGRRGSLRAQIVWLGAMSWVAYNYAVYSFGLNFTGLFLIHVAILSLAVFVLAFAVRRIDVTLLGADQWSAIPRRSTALFLWVVGAVFSALWLADSFPASLTGSLPARLVALRTTSNPVEVNDLAIVIPALVLAGVWAWQRRPIGYLLAGTLLGLATFTMAALLPGGPIFAGQAPDPMYVAVAAVSAVVWVAFVFNAGRPQTTVHTRFGSREAASLHDVAID